MCLEVRGGQLKPTISFCAFGVQREFGALGRGHPIRSRRLLALIDNAQPPRGGGVVCSDSGYAQYERSAVHQLLR